MVEINAQSRPLDVFTAWMADAQAEPRIKEPNAMALATVNRAGEPQLRVVLCKVWSEEGFIFYTNYNSRKGHDISENPRVAANFYWDPLFRQVKITGLAKKTSRTVSETYWNSRARESQLSQWISHQSETVDSRATLEKAWHAAETKFAGREIPCPEHWGGYLIEPTAIEFWVGQPGRLHDRFYYEKRSSTWTLSRLYP